MSKIHLSAEVDRGHLDPVISAAGSVTGQLRGRSDELAALTAHLDAVATGQGGLVLMSGAAGSGKSRMLEEVTRLTESRAVDVYRGGAEPGGQQRPFSTLLSALEQSPRPVLDPSSRQELAEAADPRWWLVQEVQDRLERATAQQPVVIVLDDLQWCDAESLASLQALIPRSATGGVLWLCATRDHISDAATRAGVRRLHGLADLTVSLPPLSPAAVSEVVTDAIGAAPDASLLSAVERAEGLPLLLVELLTGLRQHGLVEVDDGRARVTGDLVTPEFADLIGERLAGTSSTAQQLVGVAALLGRQFTVEQLSDLLEQPVAGLLMAVQELVREDIVHEVDGALRFRHDLVQDAIETRTPPGVRQAIRRRAVDVQLRRGSALSEVAPMLAANASPGDLAAVALLRRAAAEVASTSAATAASLSVRALELAPPTYPGRSQLVGETVSLLWQSGQPHQATQLAETALLGSLTTDAEATVRLGFARLASQFSFAAGVQQSLAALALPIESDDLRAELLATLALLYCNMGQFEDVPTTVARGLPLAEASGNFAAQATLLASASVSDFYLFDWAAAWEKQRRAVDLAERAGIARTLWVPEACWTSFLENAYGNTGQALRIADAGITSATDQRQGAVMRLWMMERSRVLLDAGRLAEARVEVEAFADTLDDLGPGNFADATVYYALGRCAILQGDTDAGAQAAHVARRMQQDEAPLVQHAGYWLAALAADARGDIDAAMALTDSAFATLTELGPSLATPDDPMDLVMLARMALRAGRRDRAELVVQVAVERARQSPDYAVLRAAAAHVRGIVAGSVDDLRLAVQLLDLLERPLAHASAVEDLARLTVWQDRQRAAMLYETALQIYRDCGATRETQRVRRRLRDLGVRGSRARRRSSGNWMGLTTAEAQIARLVTTGATNREIAAQLFLSPHTVGTHLKHVYEKVAVNSRVELTRALSSAPPELRNRS